MRSTRARRPCSSQRRRSPTVCSTARSTRSSFGSAAVSSYTATDLNHNQGTQTIEQVAEVIARMAELDPSGPTGSFFAGDGVVRW